jgi:hypothetical protein
VDPEADEGDDEEHHRRQRVDQEAHADRQVPDAVGRRGERPGGHPLVEVLLEASDLAVASGLLATGVASQEDVGDDQQAEHGRQAHDAAGDQADGLLADPAAQQEAVQKRPQERQARDDPEQIAHRFP